MAMQKVSEMTTEPIVGMFYLVPCAQIRFGTFVPVIGDWHSDPDLGVKYQHLHVDVRFLVEEDLEHQPRMNFDREFSPAQRTMGRLVTTKDQHPFAVQVTTTTTPILKRRKCRRVMPEMPRLAQFDEARQIGRKILCGKCPHRGMPLESLPQDENGHVICNGHGLKIDMKKGEVVAR